MCCVKNCQIVKLTEQIVLKQQVSLYLWDDPCINNQYLHKDIYRIAGLIYIL